MRRARTKRTIRIWATIVCSTLLATAALSALSAAVASGATAWTASTAPLGGLTTGVYANPGVTFGKVVPGATSDPEACPSTSWCVAVGSYNDASGHLQGLIETWSAGSWTSQTAPLTNLSPAAANNPGVYFYALSCPSTTSCVAVGSYDDASGNQQGLIETLSGGIWTAQTAPLANLSPPAASDPMVTLTGLSCPSATSCVAVGSYSGTRQDALIETLTGQTWTSSNAPLTGLNPDTIPDSMLLGLSCATASSCVAVGQYQDITNAYQGLIETLSNGSWSPSEAPIGGLNPVAVSPPTVLLTSLSCPSISSCVAVGFYDATTGVQGLIETLANGAWAASTAPTSGLSPAAADPPADPLTSVSCPSVTTCVIVGSYTDSSGYQQGLIETLSNGLWTASTATASAALSPPAATLNDPSVSLTGLSCASTSSCVAVGSYVDSSGYQQGLIETLTSGSWTASAATASSTLVPAAATNPAVNLAAVSCPGVGTCVAIGTYDDASGNQWGLVESELTTTTTTTAATCTWTDASGTTNDWSDGGNWSGTGCTGTGGPPAGASLVFPTPIPNGATPTNDLTAGTVFDSLTIEDGYTLSGNAITLDPASGTGITVTGIATVTINTPIVLGAGQTFSSTNTAVHLFGTISDGTHGYGLTLSGYLWNVDPLSAGGAGSNTYGGGTTIDGNGYTSLATNAGFGSGPVTITPGSTLLVDSSVTLANAVTVGGSGTGGNGAIAEGGGVAGSTLSGPVTLTGDTTVISPNQGQSLAFTGGITGDYRLTVNQSSSDLGTVVVASSGTFSGGTTVAGGILQITNATALGSGPVTVESGATIQESSATGITVGNPLTLNGAGSTSAGASGALDALAGTDGWAGSVTLGSASTVATDAANATLLLISGVGGTGPLTINAPAGGAGMVELLQAGTYSGGTIVTNGATARIANAQALSGGTVTVQSGGELQVNAVASLANALHLAGTGVHTTTLTGALEWFGANLTLTAPLALDGSASVANLGSDGHTLTLGAGVTGTGALSTAGPVVLAPGANATNTLGLTALAGTLQVDGAVADQTTATNATIDGAGASAGLTVGCGATLHAGDSGPGTITTTAGLSLGCASGPVTLDVAIDGTAPGSGYSQVLVRSGTVVLGGAALSVNFEAGLTSAPGDVYDIVVNEGGSAVTGELTDGGVALSEGSTITVSGRTLRVSYVGGASGHDVTLTDVTSPPPPPPPPPAPSRTLTATSLSASPNPAIIGQTVTYTSTVSPVPNGGTVTFFDGAAAITGCVAETVNATTPTASCTVSYSSAGSHVVDATYSGDGAYRGSSTTSLTEVVNAPAATTTSVSVSPASVTRGRAVSYSAAITSAGGADVLSGTVRFVTGDVTLCTAVLSAGGAACTATTAPMGTDVVTATYSGDATHAGSSASATLRVRPLVRRPRAFRVTAPVWTGRSVVVEIVGSELYGRPWITSDAAGTRVEVLHDTATHLSIRVSVNRDTRRGEHAFTIVFAHGEVARVNYLQR